MNTLSDIYGRQVFHGGVLLGKSNIYLIFNCDDYGKAMNIELKDRYINYYIEDIFPFKIDYLTDMDECGFLDLHAQNFKKNYESNYESILKEYKHLKRVSIYGEDYLNVIINKAFNRKLKRELVNKNIVRNKKI